MLVWAGSSRPHKTLLGLATLGSHVPPRATGLTQRVAALSLPALRSPPGAATSNDWRPLAN